jgi:hypothetical protein
MNRSVVLGAAMLFGAALPAMAQVTQVNTAGQLTGSSITKDDFESVIGGVSYSSNSGVTRASASAFASGVTTSGTMGLTTLGFPDPIRMTFVNAVQSVGLYFGNDDRCCSSVFTAYLDAFQGTTLLGTVAVVANMNDFVDQFIGLTSTAPITSAVVRYGNGSDVGLYTYIDDVQFGAFESVTATPEPASILLMGTALIGLGGFQWRRRKSAAAG